MTDMKKAEGCLSALILAVIGGVFGLMLGTFLGQDLGEHVGREKMRAEAIEHGAAHWTIDPVTGEKEFRWATQEKAEGEVFKILPGDGPAEIEATEVIPPA